MSNPQPETKKTLAARYGITPGHLSDCLNFHYFEELQEVGYRKNMRILPPIVVRKFEELYGTPEENK